MEQRIIIINEINNCGKYLNNDDKIIEKLNLG